jgi:uncharacterized protein (DUF433 family)
MATQTRSFRFDAAMLKRLEERANEIDRSASALAARYIEEGLRLDQHPGIVFVERPAGRRAMLAGTRLNVANVVGTAKAAGSAEEAAESLDLPLLKIRAALRYYADFSDEIDAEIERDRRLAEREEARWRAEQSALT